MRVALLQLNASDDPQENLSETLALVSEAALSGADLILTPEVTNCVSSSRSRQAEVLETEASDPTLSALCAAFAEHGVWGLIGSLGLKGGADGRFLNRSFLIDPRGTVQARYDKIHMFDVAVSGAET